MGGGGGRPSRPPPLGYASGVAYARDLFAGITAKNNRISL